MAVTSATPCGFPKRNSYFLQYREHSNLETMFETRDLGGFAAIPVPGSSEFSASLRKSFYLSQLASLKKRYARLMLRRGSSSDSRKFLPSPANYETQFSYLPACPARKK
jgi:hypothetical protein